jgi:drug/metabolite transporter (DMT)-like permease
MGAGSGAMFGFFTLWMRRMRYADPFAVTAIDNAGVALIAGLVLWWLRPSELQLIPRAVSGHGSWLVPMTLAAMGTVQIAIPYVLFNYGLTRVPAVEGSLLALVEPLLNPVWVALFAGEIPSRATLVGGSLILFGLASRYLLFGQRGFRTKG